jgi:NADH:ubiquinone oxidoreductase subunit K
MRLYRSYGWALGIAGICYNVSHWILAVQYWTLSTKLEVMLNGTSMKTFKMQARCIFVIGLLLNISTGVTIVVNVYKRCDNPNIY